MSRYRLFCPAHRTEATSFPCREGIDCSDKSHWKKKNDFKLWKNCQPRTRGVPRHAALQWAMSNRLPKHRSVQSLLFYLCFHNYESRGRRLRVHTALSNCLFCNCWPLYPSHSRRCLSLAPAHQPGEYFCCLHCEEQIHQSHHWVS